MSRIWLVPAAILAVTSPLGAQSHVGLVAGYSTVRTVAEQGDAGPLRPPRHGFVPGLSGTIALSGRVGLTSEVLYVQKGFTRTNVFDLDIRYLEFPLLLSARYPVGAAQLVVLGGGTFALRVHCTATSGALSSTPDVNDCVDTDRGEIVPPTDLSLTAGFGLAYHRWTLTGQYELTGRNLPENSPGLGLQHRTLILLLGFDFLRGKPRP